MKNYINLTLTLIFIFTISKVKSQGNLQFNRAIYENFSGSSQGWFRDTLIVSNGKVCKITSVGLNPYTNTDETPILYLDDVPLLFIYRYNTDDLSNSRKLVDFPIWLNEGTYIFKFRSKNSATIYAYYSGVEFNIIQ